MYLLLMLVDNGCQLNFYVATSMLKKWPPSPCKSEEQAIARERKHFSEICKLQTFRVQCRPVFVAAMSYEGTKAVTDTQTNRLQLPLCTRAPSINEDMLRWFTGGQIELCCDKSLQAASSQSYTKQRGAFDTPMD